MHYAWRQAAAQASMIVLPVGSRIGAALGGNSTAPPTSAAAIPNGFDAGAFARSAKAQFVALQSANDAGDLQRLRDYLTPLMFEVVRDEVQARGGGAQHTEVFGLDAQVVDVAEESARYVVSVQFTGRVREQAGAVPEESGRSLASDQSRGPAPMAGLWLAFSWWRSPTESPSANASFEVVLPS